MPYKNKEDEAAYKKIYREKNREKIKAYDKAYNQKNKERLGIKAAKYLSTEKGFLLNLYKGCKKRTKEKQVKDPSKEDFNLSQEEFLNLWEEHKAKHGMTCGYTGEPIIIQRLAPNKNGKQNPKPKNLLSVDRLEPEKGYTKENIVFCGWAFNERKNAVRIKDCHLIIRKHKERN
tara:strand:- start:353 stop:877 length:525 start_codon:yes stop_codon:yes gene_type:complete